MALMAARLDSSKNWVTDCSTIGKGNPKYTLTDFVFIMKMTWELWEDKTWELDLT